MDLSGNGRRAQRVTIRDVARDAGVSVAAVSKVLREAYGVSDALRAKVRDSMERLGYRPLAAARGMRGQTYTLGVTLSDIRNPFFTDLMAGINAALERTQYQPLVGISHSTSAIEAGLIESMMDRQMDGLILVAPHLTGAPLADLARRIPIVVVGQHQPNATEFDTVNNDDELGAELVVRHLAEQSFARIAMLSLAFDRAGSVEATVNGRRETGYRRAMAGLGLKQHINVVRAAQTLREIQTTARHMLEGPNRPEALFCWTDFVALEVISVATELGLSIPDDLAVVGYDNTFLCDLAQNDLTSVDQSGETLGLQCARLLIERIKGRGEAQHFMVKPRVVVRASSQKR
ncbi:LacI family DNA-binding transcriptional regulator [Chelativorans sp.]|uniref:LacI family DNA-binding transcriptional regulator n=1 Tax=Chelativorans sp. TaxID=2203393 RepID=UPI002810EB51|nr:LacI family DNA-binding transcriptional regulator [Chelativorans sp.]